MKITLNSETNLTKQCLDKTDSKIDFYNTGEVRSV